MITEKYKLFITVFELWHKYYLSGLTPGRRCRYEACNIFSGDKKILYKHEDRNMRTTINDEKIRAMKSYVESGI